MKIEDLLENIEDNDHLSSNEQTPLRPDAFDMSDADKIASILYFRKWTAS